MKKYIVLVKMDFRDHSMIIYSHKAADRVLEVIMTKFPLAREAHVSEVTDEMAI